jgi:uncharacterized protein
MDKIERRFFPIGECRVVMEGGKKMLRGHAAVFNSQSLLLAGMFREIIKPGAFRSALKSSDPRCLRDHVPSMILGRMSSGTLTLSEDEKGVPFACDMPGTTYANDLQISMSRGDVRECSFGFSVREGGDKWEQQADGTYLRTILEDGIEELYDVSPVTYPAYPDTACAMRSLDKIKGEQPPPFNDNDIKRRRLELANAAL